MLINVPRSDVVMKMGRFNLHQNNSFDDLNIEEVSVIFFFFFGYVVN